MGLSDYKDVYDLLKKAGNVEAQEQIMQLREEHLQTREELLKLRDENRLLKERMEAAASLTFEVPYYWRETPKGRDGPFCQVCQDNEKKPVRLQPRSTRGAWDCKVCDTYFTDQNYREPDWHSEAKSGDWMGV
jgi:hypothetical protein